MGPFQDSSYTWPRTSFDPQWWRTLPGQGSWSREMPEDPGELRSDSRWPAFFPSPLSIVTTTRGRKTAVEKVVGASIVNRFPYVIALSFCKEELSSRHYVRNEFMSMLEAGGSAVVQFLPVGPELDTLLKTIAEVPDSDCTARLARSGLKTRQAVTNDAPVLASAYMAYEASLVSPTRDFEGQPIYEHPWIDAGSHRVYFLEITAIQLRSDIAQGRSSIHWRSLPAWSPVRTARSIQDMRTAGMGAARYTKGYTPHYTFPSAGTIAFEADQEADGMAVKFLPPLAEDQVEVDNDRARWPCFFPSSAGLITTWTSDGVPNLMPCGSTTVVSRHPMIIAPCVSYAAINERYAPRASLSLIRETRRFGCGVPFINERIINAIKYAGNISIASDPGKVAHTGLEVRPSTAAPILCEVPVHFDCEVVGEVRLGTHIMFLGEVRRIEVRDDVSPQNPLEWYPWADVRPVSAPVTTAGMQAV